MICNNKQEALKRCNELVYVAQTATDIMREIIKIELKDHIRNWNITKEEFANSHKEVA